MDLPQVSYWWPAMNKHLYSCTVVYTLSDYSALLTHAFKYVCSVWTQLARMVSLRQNMDIETIGYQTQGTSSILESRRA